MSSTWQTYCHGHYEYVVVVVVADVVVLAAVAGSRERTTIE